MTELKERFTQLTKKLSEGIHERDEVIAVSLLAALSGQNIFLYGPPGTAKSLISRRLSSAFKTKNYFEYLMQRFSTPEEVFGPVSIAELKKDNYIRKTNGFLPEADFAFLDEIWKSSPAILNTLLTVINEKRFKNGVNLMEVPLKVLISASNETPPENQGLEALYDRFLVRLNVPPMQNRDNFEALLQSSPTSSAIEIPQKLKISHDEWEFWQLEIDEIKLSKETLHIAYDSSATDECAHCNFCQSACFVEIDPRQTQTYDACINCGECITACESIRGSRKTGASLLSFAMGQPQAIQEQPRNAMITLRSRLFWILPLVTLGLGMFIWGLVSYEPYRFSVYHSDTAQGREINEYRISLAHKFYKPSEVAVAIEGLPEGSYQLESDSVMFDTAQRKYLKFYISDELEPGFYPFLVKVKSADDWQSSFRVHHISVKK